MMAVKAYAAGIDVGSTTIKLALYNETSVLVHSAYRRHHARTVDMLIAMLSELKTKLGSIYIDVAFTGSAGLGIAEKLCFPFLQELVLSSSYIKNRHPDVRTYIEIGGEDAKIIFFDDKLQAQIRMNGSCAGGTGAFIDQMSMLLNVSLKDFGSFAQEGRNIYPIASRCGVFAKTDIQSLLSNRAAKKDIAASIFHAMALQVLASLARGTKIRSKVLFAGGPLTFFTALRDAFVRILNIDRERDIVSSSHPELIAASGAALFGGDARKFVNLDELLRLLTDKPIKCVNEGKEQLPALFSSVVEKEEWEKRHSINILPRVDISDLKGPCFLGIDSGSTTTKIVLIDEEKRLVMDYYIANNGNSLLAASKGMIEFHDLCRHVGIIPQIVRTAATGYGEDLVKAAFNIDDGIVETMAHYRAAKYFNPKVTFILDIGGQDMKAIYVLEGMVADVQINEACSSGCGSFIETFAHSLNYDVGAFAQLACEKCEPFDLGTRCTVFMNSRVKQALREGATISDISAGLAYAVVKNSLFKVLKIRDIDTLGEHIVVQGGTFCNPAVLRAFELLIGREVLRPDMSQIMGAYGAALTALNNYHISGKASSTFKGLSISGNNAVTKRKTFPCQGCENSCHISKLTFKDGASYTTGNRCDRNASSALASTCGDNLIDEKLKLLFSRKMTPDETAILTFGIPRVLNIYENFPFWCTFLVSCGFKVALSAPSSIKLFEKGVGTVMSDNVCFPGKLAHGHILDLIEKKVDRIFYPTVVFEGQEYAKSLNSFNCPVVTGYPDVVRSAVDPEGERDIPMDSPVISFKDRALLTKQLYAFVKSFGVDKDKACRAVKHAFASQYAYKSKLRELTSKVIRNAEASGKLIIVLAGRPYHIDPLVNHGIPGLFHRLEAKVVPEDGLLLAEEDVWTDDHILTQWAYTNRIIAVAKYVASSRIRGMVMLTSFGCGLDALAADEAREIVTRANKVFALIKIDEIANLSAANIRLRAMIEAIKDVDTRDVVKMEKHLNPSGASEKDKTIIVPWFSPYYSPLIKDVFEGFDYKLETLPPQDRQSVETGLRFVNNDMCYPAVILIGDVLKALQTGKYDATSTAILFTQTFGQCRASNYVPLMKKALCASGFGEITVLSITGGDSNLRFVLEANRHEFVKKLSMGLIFSDALNRIYLATAAHEIKPGTAEALRNMVMAEISVNLKKGQFKPLLSLLKEMISAFNRIETHREPLPVIGILGEIFVKYNPYSNHDMVAWLIKQGIEVVLPSLIGFFTQRFVNEEFNQQVYLKRSLKDRAVSRLLDAYIHFYLHQVEGAMRNFRYYRKNDDLDKLAVEVSRVTSLANQSGEGWLLIAEMIAMLRCGINNIICLQPFGCLANHVTGKGVEKRMKTLYPHLNLHFLDMDAGVSEVNVLNRLHFIIAAAENENSVRNQISAA